MASPRIAVCFLAILATVSAFVVAGCGGDSSSAPATAGGTSATTSSEGGGGKDEASAEGQSGDKEGKKHPPLDLPKGKPEEGPTPEQRASVPRADIEMKVPGTIVAGVPPLPKDSTCKGKNVSPALEWNNIPSGTDELVLFAMNLAPVNGKLYFNYAVAGLDPSLTELKEGELPDGAIVGRNSAGQTKYSICPKGPEGETYVFALYAVPKSLSPKQGFEPLALRKEATKVSPSVGITTLAYVPE